MTTPGLGGMRPAGEDDISRRLRALEAQVQALSSARSLESATIGKGGLTVAGGSIRSQNFNGDVEAGTAGTAGFGFGGDAGNAVLNNLTLRGGIIGNDALTSPVTAGRYDGTTTSLTINGTTATRHSGTIAVPSGFTQALVMAFAQIGGTNPNATLDGLRCAATIAGVAGDTVTESVEANRTGHAAAMFTRLVTGLNGGTITVTADGATAGQTWTGATARVSALALFLR